jgi:hypothetical protein
MQRQDFYIEQDKDDQDEQSTPKFTLNYHKNRVFGGVGHLSLYAKHGDETVKLSVYPDETLSFTSPLAVVTAYIFPNKAVHRDHLCSTDSPIEAAYDISDMMNSHHDSFNEIKKIRQSIDSGKSAFSLTPNWLTNSIHALFSPHVSTFNVVTGQKMFHREMIDEELKNVDVINCAESTARVLEKGGLCLPKNIGAYYTPSGINKFFATRLPNIHVKNDLPENDSEQRTSSLLSSWRRGDLI